MRPIHPNSTDVLYSRYPLDYLVELTRAHAKENINFISKACLDPRRSLYHSCVNHVCARLYSGDSLDEKIRGTIIADRADAIYEKVLPSFEHAIKNAQPEMDRKYNAVEAFIKELQPEENIPWDKEGFLKRWPADHFPHRWQKKAIETYALVRENVESGKYKPSEGWSALRATHAWSNRNLDYKHYRDLSRTLVNDAIDTMFSNDEKLEFVPSHKRNMLIVSGGMGSGKSHFTTALWSQRPEESRKQTVVHDADFMKLAIGRSAVRDQKIREFSGPEIQNESSVALFENTLKRHYMAWRNERGPHVIINSTVAGSFELDEGLEGNGNVQHYHLSTDPNDVWEDICARAYKTSRMPDRDSVNWSNRASTRNLLTLADRPGTKIQSIWYNRKAGQEPEIAANLDMQAQTLNIFNLALTCEIAGRAQLAPRREDAIRLFFKTLMDKGITIQIHALNHSPHITLTPEGQLTSTATTLPAIAQQVLVPLTKSVTCGDSSIATRREGINHSVT